MYRKYTQVNVLVTTLLLSSINVSVYAQTYHFTSKASGYGLWTDENTWIRNFNYVDNFPNTVGNKNSGSEIYSHVERVGNLTLGKGNDFVVHGILRVEGDLTLTGSAQLVIEEGGILWVSGRLTMDKGSNLHVKSGSSKPDGILVVGLDTNISGGADILVEGEAVFKQDLTIASGSSDIRDSSGDYYVYGTTQFESNILSGIPDKNDLFVNDRDLYNYAEGNGPLPITLLSFEGYATAKGVILDWVTETEENFDFFTVERAGSDLQFEAVAKIEGQGFSTQSTDYNFIDEDFLVGVVYYRLKATDYDGFEEYHKVIAVMIDEEAQLQSSVFPNPVVNKQIQVQTSSANGQLQIFNHYGNSVFQSSLQVGSNVYALPNHLSAGFYTVVVSNHQGQREQHRVLIR